MTLLILPWRRGHLPPPLPSPQKCYAMNTFPKLCNIQSAVAYLTRIKVIKIFIGDNIKTKRFHLNSWVYTNTHTHTHTQRHTHIYLYIIKANVIKLLIIALSGFEICCFEIIKDKWTKAQETLQGVQIHSLISYSFDCYQLSVTHVIVLYSAI